MSINYEEFEKVVIETDEKNPVTIAVLTADTVEIGQGYRIKITPKTKNYPFGGNGSLP